MENQVEDPVNPSEQAVLVPEVQAKPVEKIDGLEKLKEKRLGAQTEIVDAAKLLLSSNEAREIEALQAIGLDDHINHAVNNVRLNILNKQLEETYEGTIYHISE